ncbi:actin cytoskeleton and mitosis protein [Sporothrix stenoceras]|uniref:Actin cytoskeleton and mitosis protein n=1 Tax=Sporothrix stenoceras TaxID=5173 RepID=A0ABR3Z3I5_9PEZI
MPPMLDFAALAAARSRPKSTKDPDIDPGIDPASASAKSGTSLPPASTQTDQSEKLTVEKDMVVDKDTMTTKTDTKTAEKEKKDVDELAASIGSLDFFSAPATSTAFFSGPVADPKRDEAEAGDYLDMAQARPKALVRLTALAEPASELSLSLASMSLSGTGNGSRPRSTTSMDLDLVDMGNPFLRVGNWGQKGDLKADVKDKDSSTNAAGDKKMLAPRKKTPVYIFLAPKRKGPKPPPVSSSSAAPALASGHTFGRSSPLASGPGLTPVALSSATVSPLSAALASGKSSFASVTSSSSTESASTSTTVPDKPASDAETKTKAVEEMSDSMKTDPAAYPKDIKPTADSKEIVLAADTKPAASPKTVDLAAEPKDIDSAMADSLSMAMEGLTIDVPTIIVTDIDVEPIDKPTDKPVEMTSDLLSADLADTLEDKFTQFETAAQPAIKPAAVTFPIKELVDMTEVNEEEQPQPAVATDTDETKESTPITVALPSNVKPTVPVTSIDSDDTVVEAKKVPEKADEKTSELKALSTGLPTSLASDSYKISKRAHRAAGATDLTADYAGKSTSSVPPPSKKYLAKIGADSLPSLSASVPGEVMDDLALHAMQMRKSAPRSSRSGHDAHDGHSIMRGQLSRARTSNAPSPPDLSEGRLEAKLVPQDLSVAPIGEPLEPVEPAGPSAMEVKLPETPPKTDGEAIQPTLPKIVASGIAAFTPPITPSVTVEASISRIVATPSKKAGAKYAICSALSSTVTPVSDAEALFSSSSMDDGYEGSSDETKPKRRPIRTLRSILKRPGFKRPSPNTSSAARFGDATFDYALALEVPTTSKKRSQDDVVAFHQSTFLSPPRKRVLFEEAKAPADVPLSAASPARVAKRPAKRAGEDFAPGPICVNKVVKANDDDTDIDEDAVHEDCAAPPSDVQRPSKRSGEDVESSAMCVNKSVKASIYDKYRKAIESSTSTSEPPKVADVASDLAKLAIDPFKPEKHFVLPVIKMLFAKDNGRRAALGLPPRKSKKKKNIGAGAGAGAGVGGDGSGLPPMVNWSTQAAEPTPATDTMKTKPGRVGSARANDRAPPGQRARRRIQDKMDKASQSQSQPSGSVATVAQMELPDVPVLKTLTIQDVTDAISSMAIAEAPKPVEAKIDAPVPPKPVSNVQDVTAAVNAIVIAEPPKTSDLTKVEQTKVEVVEKKKVEQQALRPLPIVPATPATPGHKLARATNAWPPRQLSIKDLTSAVSSMVIEEAPKVSEVPKVPGVPKMPDARNKAPKMFQPGQLSIVMAQDAIVPNKVKQQQQPMPLVEEKKPHQSGKPATPVTNFAKVPQTAVVAISSKASLVSSSKLLTLFAVLGLPETPRPSHEELAKDLPTSCYYPQPRRKQQQQKRALPDPLYDIKDNIELAPKPDRIMSSLAKLMHTLTLLELNTGFSTGFNATTANGDTAASSAVPSNPFGAPSGNLNPFKAASAAPTTAPAFGGFSSTPTPAQPTAAATANPFQAAMKANAPPAFGAASSSQPTTAAAASSPFGPQATASAPSPSPFQTAQQPATARGASPNPFLAQQPSAAPATGSPFGSTSAPAASASPFGNTPTPATAPSTGFSGFQPAPAAAGFGQPTAAPAPTFTPTPAPAATGFGQPTPSAGGFGGQPAASTGSASAFGGPSQPASNPFSALSKPPASTPSPSPFAPTSVTAPAPVPSAAATSGAASLAAAKAAAKKSVHFNLDPVASQSQPSQPASSSNAFNKPKPAITASSSRFSFSSSSQQSPASGLKESQTDYAKKILAQLQKDRLKAPQWPADPGNPANAAAMDAFWTSYGNYRDKVRESLVKAGLIDDPKVRKRLDEAIDFKGICEEMCPEFEKIERIQQHNVMMAEKSESPDGTMWPSPPLMVKALTRSSAGQEAPLPMDVRTVAALKRTLDHLIDDVLGDDSRLPAVHNFLWDRTRAIRRDFIFHSNMSEEEMRQQIYCFEVITRFHATSLHLLSQKGFAPEGFDQRQEREQLSKALLSLLQAYDDCKDRRIACANECEFRAYFILLNAHDPNFQHKVSEWGIELWYDSDDVQTAMTLAQAMQSIWDWRGPIKPTMPTTTALGAFATFFRIIESPQISYTMACLAEMHFVHVRRGILRNMTRAYARARDSPKDLTLQALNDMLRFDTLDECWDFVLENKLEFSSEDKATAHLVLEKSVQISSMPIPQSFSQNLVERKRAGRSLPEALHITVYEDPEQTSSNQTTTATSAEKTGSDLFVSQSQAPVNAAPPVVFPTTTPATTTAPAAASSSAPSIFSQPATAASTSTSASAPSIFSRLGAGSEKKKDAAPLLFQTTTPATDKGKAPASSTTPFAAASSTSVLSSPFSTTPTSSPAKLSGLATSTLFTSGAPKSAPSIFDTKTPASTTAAPASTLFSQAASSTSAPASTSFSALFPTSTPATSASDKPTTTTTSSSSSAPPLSFSSTNPLLAASAAKKASEKTSVLETTTTPKPATSTTPSSATSTLAPTATAPQKSLSSSLSASAPAPPPPPQPPVSTPQQDLMGDFTKWLVLGDNGIVEEFKEAFVEHLVRQTFEKHQRDEEERIKREEDEKSWEDALRFKTYNLRVKFFYRWRNIARERALDRRARQARDELKAYRAAKRAEKRAAAEKAAAEEREKAAEERRNGSKEVKFLEDLGYYGDFGASAASSRKRKAYGADAPLPPHARSVSMSAVDQQQPRESTSASASLSPLQQQLQVQQQPGQPEEAEEAADYALRSSGFPPIGPFTDGLISTARRVKAVFKTKVLNTPAFSNGMGMHPYDDNELFARSRRRGSLAASIDEDNISNSSLLSVRSKYSPDGSKIAYYRRSIPGRARKFFTRVPADVDPSVVVNAAHGTNAAASTSTTTTTPPGKKITNFMLVKKTDYGFGTSTRSARSGSDSGVGGNRVRPATAIATTTVRPATASPSPSSFSTSVAGSGVGGVGSGSKVKSSYWRLRAMGMVQMPNKQYLHESLALPMLQDGKRFPGVGNYGLPPVPAWQDQDSTSNKNDELTLVTSGDGEHFIIDDDEEDDETRRRRYAEERLRRTAVTPSRKRLFSSGDGSQDGTIGATATATSRPATVAAAMAANLVSPPDAKKARVTPNNNDDGGSASTPALTEAERIIKEMRETADAMDDGRTWFAEQTEAMRNGTSAWDD